MEGGWNGCPVVIWRKGKVVYVMNLWKELQGGKRIVIILMIEGGKKIDVLLLENVQVEKEGG